MISSKLPRGLRNNNPFNIKKSLQPWQGKRTISPDGSKLDPTFESFQSMRYGVRAGLKLLYNYIYLYGDTTVYKILSRFAPRSENATDAYCQFIENYILSGIDNCGYCKDGSLVGNKRAFFKMCEGIIKYENGIGVNCLYNFKLDSKSLQDTFFYFFPNYNFNEIL